MILSQRLYLDTEQPIRTAEYCNADTRMANGGLRTHTYTKFDFEIEMEMDARSELISFRHVFAILAPPRLTVLI